MSNTIAAEMIAQASSDFDQNCANAVIIGQYLQSILTYDYVLTLGSEVYILWRCGGPVSSKVAFFFTRLYIIGFVIIDVIGTYYTPVGANSGSWMCLINVDLSFLSGKIGMAAKYGNNEPLTFTYSVSVLQSTGFTLAEMAVIAATWMDGAVYFLIVLALNIGCTINYLASETLSWLSSMIISLQPVLLSRMLINLRDASQRDIHMGLEDLSVEDDGFQDTTAELSTLGFRHSNTVRVGDDEASAGEYFPSANNIATGSSSIDHVEVYEQARDGIE
ncbi:hypothetical protein DAEQUDRAFT_757879 [Daedalea quercina L-15889]|uniref:DUF6533 domain-containing protein n=1 Tax=Daedalea quercina L-15889 TaxID=1314783 RepID=A0A165PAJ5_9APHY|nr:hypothetical protein DAEQUDRAFT_757879 [Daedalea quercina L-15889]